MSDDCAHIPNYAECLTTFPCMHRCRNCGKAISSTEYKRMGVWDEERHRSGINLPIDDHQEKYGHAPP